MMDNQMTKDFNNWVKSFFKRKKINPRFKKTVLLSEEKSESKYSKAINQLLLINTFVFIFLWICEYTPFYDSIVSHFLCSTSLPIVITKPWTILTSGFTHQQLFHFIMNMMGLLMCVQLMKNILTNKQVWNVYILSVLAGSLAFLAFYNLLPHDPQLVAVGTARGASAGVLGLLTVLCMKYPNLKISMFFIPCNLKWVAYINIITSVAMVLFNFNAGGGIAHLGGMALAWVYMKQLDQKRDIGAIFNPLRKILYLFKKKKPQYVSYKSQYSSTSEDLIRKTIKGL